MIVTGRTRAIGIFGCPVEHSLSPVMQNAAFRALNLDYVYVPFNVEPESLKNAVEGIRALGLKGLNITIPHKQMVIEYLDSISKEARLIGAVNTVVNEGGILKGYNTDGVGFTMSLRENGTEPQGAGVFLIGAGGAARAVAVQMALEGSASICILVRKEDLWKARSIAEIINGQTEAKAEVIELKKFIPARMKGKNNIIVNCTPIGMHPHTGDTPPVDLEGMPEGVVVCDLVYNPLETLFLKKAREIGLKTVSGIGMLLYQGAAAFELWTGESAPVEVMKQALFDAKGQG